MDSTNGLIPITDELPERATTNIPVPRQAETVFNSLDWAEEQMTKSVAVVIPTYNEASNMNLLIQRLSGSLQGFKSQVIIVDDSPTDDTVEAAREAAEPFSTPWFQVTPIWRTNGSRWGGLGGAVTDGLRELNPDDIRFAVVMDADLQHPPERIPDMIKAVALGADIVVGSRYCKGGSSEGLDSRLRHAVSLSSTYVAKLLFPRSLHGVTDPMAGFYAMRVGSVDPHDLEPKGFKILLETLVRNHGLRVTEVAIHFGARHSGDSKASFSKGMTYLSHLTKLRFDSWRNTLRKSVNPRERGHERSA